MASPQTGNGFIRIANELWDEVIRRDFSKRQKDIIDFIWRLSYGCQKKTAYIPKLVYFELCGIGRNHIKEELQYLESCRVIFWDREEKTFEVNKDHEQWQVSPVKGWKEFKFDELLHLNMQKSSQNGNEKVPKKGMKKFPKQELFDEEESEMFPKREQEGSQNGNIFSEKVPKTGTSTLDNPSNDAASRVSKDIFKDSIKNSSSTRDNTCYTGAAASAVVTTEDFSFGKIYRIYEEHFTEDNKVTQFEVEDLSDMFDTYGGEWLLEAMREAVRAKVRTLKYINGVLKGFQERGGPGKPPNGQAPPAAPAESGTSRTTGPPTPSADQTREFIERQQRLIREKQERLRQRAEETVQHGT
jgi:phage replication O-like protein O